MNAAQALPVIPAGHRLKRFTNCQLLGEAGLVWDDLWVAEGRFLRPRDAFYGARRTVAARV
jgi:hypothetical protein